MKKAEEMNKARAELRRRKEEKGKRGKSYWVTLQSLVYEEMKE